jgi:hypothetical protein
MKADVLKCIIVNAGAIKRIISREENRCPKAPVDLL